MHYFNLKTSIALFICLVSLPAFADIYEYIDEAGVSHFSDTPNDANYVLIIKTEEMIVETKPPSAATLAPSSQPNVTQNADNMTLNLTQPQLIAQIAPWIQLRSATTE